MTHHCRCTDTVQMDRSATRGSTWPPDVTTRPTRHRRNSTCIRSKPTASQPPECAWPESQHSRARSRRRLRHQGPERRPHLATGRCGDRFAPARPLEPSDQHRLNLRQPPRERPTHRHRDSSGPRCPRIASAPTGLPSGSARSRGGLRSHAHLDLAIHDLQEGQEWINRVLAVSLQ